MYVCMYVYIKTFWDFPSNAYYKLTNTYEGNIERPYISTF